MKKKHCILLRILDDTRPKVNALFSEFLVRKANEPSVEYYHGSHYADGSIMAEVEETLNMIYGEGRWDENDLNDYLQYGQMWPSSYDECDYDFDGCETLYPCEDDEDDGCYDNAYDDFWEGYHARKRNKKHDKLSGNDWTIDNYYEGGSSKKKIYFYYDYHDKKKRKKFTTLKQFNKFITSNAYYVGQMASDLLQYQEESHVGVDKYGTVCVDSSYETLYYTMCTDKEAEDCGMVQ